jgi:hypothetical protein
MLPTVMIPSSELLHNDAENGETFGKVLRVNRKIAKHYEE